MKPENVFDIAQELKGMSVVMQGRGQKQGQVVVRGASLRFGKERSRTGRVGLRKIARD
jgi:hypothetical protein